MTNLLRFYATIDNPVIILILLLVFFGAIALVTFILHFFVPGTREKSGPIDESTAVKEELDRVLEHITDEEILAQMDEERADDDK